MRVAGKRSRVEFERRLCFSSLGAIVFRENRSFRDRATVFIKRLSLILIGWTTQRYCLRIVVSKDYYKKNVESVSLILISIGSYLQFLFSFLFYRPFFFLLFLLLFSIIYLIFLHDRRESAEKFRVTLSCNGQRPRTVLL